jgi:hypothetical protein
MPRLHEGLFQIDWLFLAADTWRGDECKHVADHVLLNAIFFCEVIQQE